MAKRKLTWKWPWSYQAVFPILLLMILCFLVSVLSPRTLRSAQPVCSASRWWRTRTTPSCSRWTARSRRKIRPAIIDTRFIKISRIAQTVGIWIPNNFVPGIQMPLPLEFWTKVYNTIAFDDPMTFYHLNTVGAKIPNLFVKYIKNKNGLG